MSGAGWQEIGALVVGLIAREPPFIQILISLAGAFSLLMFVEGLRVSFIPQRKSPDERRDAAAPKPVQRKPVLAAPHRSALPKPPASHPKRARKAAKPHRPPRPKIRRAPAEPQKSQWSADVLPQVASFEE